MVVARAPIRKPTAPELRLLGRGLPTDRQVQDRIADRMLVWLRPALDSLWREVWERIQLDITAGRIAMPEAGMGTAARGRGDRYDSPDYWRAMADQWAEPVEEWIIEMMPLVAEYQEARFGFYAPMRLINDGALSYTRDVYIPDLIKLDGDMSIVAVRREEIRRTIEAWQRGDLPGGRGLRDLRQALERWFIPERAQIIAQTESTRVYAAGSRLSWLNAYTDAEYRRAWGIIAERWNTAADELVCPICRPLNGKQVLLNAEFPVEGGQPPAHVGCRCFLTPIRNYNPKFHPPSVPSGPKGAMSQVKRPTKGQLAEIGRLTGAA